MHKEAVRGYRALIVAPWQRDAESLAKVLAQDGYHTCIYPDLIALSEQIDENTGVVILTHEALEHGIDRLRRCLQRQPTWSDVPFVVLRSARSSGITHTVPLPAEVINRIELERPIGSVSLLSAVATSMRSRQKQFEIRDRIAELAASRHALTESEAELRVITDALPVLIAFLDVGLHYRFVNCSYQDWFGLAPADMLGKTVPEVFGEESSPAFLASMQQALSGEPGGIEEVWQHREEGQREVEIRFLPRFAQNGKVDGVHVFAADITERKASLQAAQHAAAILEQKVAERTAALQAEMQARSESETALRQAQKMEAVGQLTGGIAHDFNNMLTSIIGALDIIGMRLQEGRTDRLERIIRAAFESANRAAGLTQRLLAFSRRQSLDPKPVDLNALVQSMHMLLSQTLGERIQIKVDLAGSLHKALVDINQLESAILNLCINARDAMPDGGQLCITTRFSPSMPFTREVGLVNPAGYAVLEVADTGVGMDLSVQERVFEPFFTTKPLGQGTGLGLSMIYGFMQQSKGHVDIQSAPGRGTVIALYLPVAPGDYAANGVIRQDASIPKGEGQQILVVEDDDQVRCLVSFLLEELGYTVTTARDAMAAMPHLSGPEHIDLLISDVGLPGMNGRQLAELMREHHPAVPVLFMTGYAETAAVQSEFLGENMAIITKPFALDDFGLAVRQALASQPHRVASQAP
ncbi:PAS domain-containing protein [Dyella acidiphila]|uniref:histidine kinase n=1 Tax=Dyella acidiphila TaxID=2775866 RepID=A0ABR9G9R9_9GAMM|nr:PAS domain-containing protein [Dyella acidiphila]MBE1160799.1 PAS domain-containing protein [Dyella acidiphila]